MNYSHAETLRIAIFSDSKFPLTFDAERVPVLLGPGGEVLVGGAAGEVLAVVLRLGQEPKNKLLLRQYSFVN